MSAAASAEHCELSTGPGTMEEEDACTEKEAAGGAGGCRDQVARGVPGQPWPQQP